MVIIFRKWLKKILRRLLYFLMVIAAILTVIAFILDRIGIERFKINFEVVVNALFITQILGFGLLIILIIYMLLRLDKRLIRISSQLLHLDEMFIVRGGSHESNPSLSQEKEPEEEPTPSGGGAFGGMVVGGAIGLALGGPVGVIIGGLLGALAGNKIEQEELSRRLEERRATEEEKRLRRH